MTTTKKPQPQFIKILGWLISLFAFAIGFYHTHLAIREFKIMHENYGSYILAGLILLLLIITYYSAVNGKKIAFWFYLICATFYFIFNLTSFYPTYLARTLVTEEATSINKKLQMISNSIELPNLPAVTSKVADLNALKGKIIQQIVGQNGFGPETKRYLQNFNQITGGDLRPNIIVGKSQFDREKIASDYNNLLNTEIQAFAYKKITGSDKSATLMFEAKSSIDSLQQKYTPILKKIIEDDSKFILEVQKKSDRIGFAKAKEQTQIMQSVATALDNETAKLNQAKTIILTKKKPNISKKERVAAGIIPTIGTIKSKNIGTFEHTIASVKERFWKIDTLMIIALCMLIDYLVPLVIYFLIKKNDDEEVERKPITGKF